MVDDIENAFSASRLEPGIAHIMRMRIVRRLGGTYHCPWSWLGHDSAENFEAEHMRFS